MTAILVHRRSYRIIWPGSGLSPSIEVENDFTQEGGARSWAVRRATRLDGAAYECDARITRSRGDRHGHARGAALRDRDGTILELYGTIADITERKARGATPATQSADGARYQRRARPRSLDGGRRHQCTVRAETVKQRACARQNSACYGQERTMSASGNGTWSQLCSLSPECARLY